MSRMVAFAWTIGCLVVALATVGVWTVSAACPPASTAPAGQRWIDLTHDFSSETVYWPTAEPFKLETVSEGVTEKGYYYSAYQFCAAEHGGTHIDAPVHFAKGGRSIDQVPIGQLIGPAVVVDVTESRPSTATIVWLSRTSGAGR